MGGREGIERKRSCWTEDVASFVHCCDVVNERMWRVVKNFS